MLTVLAAAQGLTAQNRIFGGSLGLSIATIVLNSHITSDLKGVLSQEQINGLRQSLTSISSFTPEEALAVVGVFAEAFKSIMRVCIYVAAAGFVVGLFAWERVPTEHKELKHLREQRAEKKHNKASHVETSETKPESIEAVV